MSQAEDKKEIKHLRTCENCEWCVPVNSFPQCLLTWKQTALFEKCNNFKMRTANHISM